MDEISQRLERLFWAVMVLGVLDAAAALFCLGYIVGAGSHG